LNISIKELKRAVVVLTILTKDATIKDRTARYITTNRKSPESISSKPNFSQTINPYIPDRKDATAPAEVSNWGTREYFSFV
jgi:hypothetical protein